MGHSGTTLVSWLQLVGCAAPCCTPEAQTMGVDWQCSMEQTRHCCSTLHTLPVESRPDLGFHWMWVLSGKGFISKQHPALIWSISWTICVCMKNSEENIECDGQLAAPCFHYKIEIDHWIVWHVAVAVEWSLISWRDLSPCPCATLALMFSAVQLTDKLWQKLFDR